MSPLRKAKLLEVGDVLKTNPSMGYWGCALVLTVRDKTPEFSPMCHIGITTTVFTHDYDFEDLDLANLQILPFDRQIRVGPNAYAPLRRETCIGIYARKITSAVTIIGKADTVGISPTPLTFKVGDGSDGGWPLCGPVAAHLGGEAIAVWRAIHDREAWHKEVEAARGSHEEMLIRLRQEDRKKRQDAKLK